MTAPSHFYVKRLCSLMSYVLSHPAIDPSPLLQKKLRSFNWPRCLMFFRPYLSKKLFLRLAQDHWPSTARCKNKTWALSSMRQLPSTCCRIDYLYKSIRKTPETVRRQSRFLRQLLPRAIWTCRRFLTEATRFAGLHAHEPLVSSKEEYLTRSA